MVGGMDFEQAQTYRKAMFSLVENRQHWKDPIDAIVRDTPEMRDALTDAIAHFTGSVPTFYGNASGLMRVVAAGYRATIGG